MAGGQIACQLTVLTVDLQQGSGVPHHDAGKRRRREHRLNKMLDIRPLRRLDRKIGQNTTVFACDGGELQPFPEIRIQCLDLGKALSQQGPLLIRQLPAVYDLAEQMEIFHAELRVRLVFSAAVGQLE